jgi:uncharacterized 2Fe-2S/4Fe-4S cluster protein (DUF4445 family)
VLSTPNSGEVAVRARIHDIVIVGNPVMHHLLLGIDPTPLGAAPFTLTIGAPVDLRADRPRSRPAVRPRHVGPCIAGHVGADAAAALLNERTHATVEPQLMVDVGTNAEIVLGTAGRSYAASSPTGPAFEGARRSRRACERPPAQSNASGSTVTPTNPASR